MPACEPGPLGDGVDTGRPAGARDVPWDVPSQRCIYPSGVFAGRPLEARDVPWGRDLRRISGTSQHFSSHAPATPGRGALLPVNYRLLWPEYPGSVVRGSLLSYAIVNFASQSLLIYYPHEVVTLFFAHLLCHPSVRYQLIVVAAFADTKHDADKDRNEKREDDAHDGIHCL